VQGSDASKSREGEKAGRDDMQFQKSSGGQEQKSTDPVGGGVDGCRKKLKKLKIIAWASRGIRRVHNLDYG